MSAKQIGIPCVSEITPGVCVFPIFSLLFSLSVSVVSFLTKICCVCPKIERYSQHQAHGHWGLALMGIPPPRVKLCSDQGYPIHTWDAQDVEKKASKLRRSMRKNSHSAAKFWKEKEDALRRECIKEEVASEMKDQSRALQTARQARLREEREECRKLKQMERDMAIQFEKEQREAACERKKQTQETLCRIEQEWAEKLEQEKREIGRLKAEQMRLDLERKQKMKAELLQKENEQEANRLREKQRILEEQWAIRLEKERKKEEIIKAQIQATKDEIDRMANKSRSETPEEVRDIRTMDQEAKDRFEKQEEEAARKRAKKEQEELARVSREWQKKLDREREEYEHLKGKYEKVKSERNKRLRDKQFRMAEEDAADRLRRGKRRAEREWKDRLRGEKMKEIMMKAQIQKTKRERLPQVRSGGPSRSLTPSDELGAETEEQELKRLRARLKYEASAIARCK